MTYYDIPYLALITYYTLQINADIEQKKYFPNKFSIEADKKKTILFWNCIIIVSEYIYCKRS